MPATSRWVRYPVSATTSLVTAQVGTQGKQRGTANTSDSFTIPGSANNQLKINVDGAGAPAPAVRPSDPLFVIDLSDPTAPSILGELVLPGFSTYLHPFDADHLLGLGRDDCPGSTVNNPWWPRCLKLSLFDVSDLGSPKEVARYIVGEGDRAWSGSEASWDPHAFLFIPSKGLLLIPVEWSSWGSTPQEYRYFEGLFALSVSLDRGFEVVWTDTHLGGPPCPYVESAFSYSYFAYAWRCDIRRALYIGEVAYTVSQALVRMKDLVTGSLLGEVALIEG